MENYDFVIRAALYTEDELPAELRAVLQKAKEKTRDAYCPYSNYAVGAAVLLNDGTIVGGSNQENAAYPSGLCAERTALFAANANYPMQPVKALAVACAPDGILENNDGFSSPCGACRQVMIETEQRFNQDMKVVLYNKSRCIVFNSAKDLLPLSFIPDMLKTK